MKDPTSTRARPGSKQLDIFKDNVPSLPEKRNKLKQPPSLIPGVQYPISKREKHIIECTWKHAIDIAKRGIL